MREATDNIKFDTTYAHTGNVSEGPSDTSFDASVFTDANLDKYDVVFFLDTTGTTIDDSQKTARRQALQDFIEKKGRGFVGTHSATDTYQGGSWAWYVNFVGANFDQHSNAGTSGTAIWYNNTSHPILTAAGTPNPWNRTEEWYTFKSKPESDRRASSSCSPVTTRSITTERPTAWVHEMPVMAPATRGGRMFYTAFGHSTTRLPGEAGDGPDHRRHQVGRLPPVTSRKEVDDVLTLQGDKLVLPPSGDHAGRARGRRVPGYRRSVAVAVIEHR